MPTPITIPTVLRTLTGGADTVTAEGPTIAAILDDLEEIGRASCRERV